jgi:hypothetical protein
MPPVQSREVLGLVGQIAPQAPQLLGSLETVASEALSVIPSQLSSKPLQISFVNGLVIDDVSLQSRLLALNPDG